jgi:ankyrin repeat protein
VPAIDDLERIRTRRLHDTCGWVEENAIFQNWLDPNRFSVLLLEGPPGCGKSTVTTRIIELLQTGHPTAYFFCDAKDIDRQSWGQIVRTWTWQLLLQKSHLVDDIFNIYGETAGAITPLASYYKALKCLLRRGENAFLILDGLDESKDLESHLSNSIIHELTRYAKIMFVSRPGPMVDFIAERASGSFGKVIVRPESNATDIARLVSQGVQSLHLNTAISKTIVNRLVQGANGMFLWAYLMLRHISQLTTLAALDDLPEGLEELYIRIIGRIMSLPANQSRLASRVLQWTYSAVRQLSVAELGIALSVKPGSDHHDERNEIQSLAVAIRNCCSPLLEVDETRGSVRFVHSSAVEFLRQIGSSPTQSLGLRALPIVPDIRNEYTAAVCLTYLGYDHISYVSDDEDTRAYDKNLRLHLESNGFLEYCALNWWKHLPLLKTNIEDTQESFRVSVVRFASSESTLVKWLQLFRLLDGPRLGKLHKDESFSPGAHRYHWMSEVVGSKFSQLWLAPNGLFTRWDRWITESFFNGRHSTPIGIAAFFNFTNAVESELERGVSVDTRDSVGLTPLLYSAHGDAADTLQQLLHHGADVQATSLMGFSSIRYASRNCTTVLPILLERGASISTQEKNEGLNPLHATCVSIGWHPMVLRELLKWSTNEHLNAVDFMGRTPLHLAAAIDLKMSARLIKGRLIQASKSKPQVYAVSAQEAFTPVLAHSIHIWATAWGSPLSRLATDTTSNHLRRDVSILVQKIKTTIIFVLGQKGPRIDTLDAFGQSPLHLASAASFSGRGPELTGHETDPVIQSLLDLGSIAEGRNASGQRPLDIALAQGSWMTALTLLRVDAVNGVLLDSNRRSMEAIILQNAASEQKGRSQPAMFASMKEGHHPKSLLDALEVSYILQARLSLSTPPNVLTSGIIVEIVSSILDFAEYWAISTNEVSINTDQFARKPPPAAVQLGKGRVRRLEIYVARPPIRRGSRMGCCHRLRHSPYARYGFEYTTAFSGLLYSSWHSSVLREEQNPLHKDGALLQLAQRSVVSIDGEKEATLTTRSVSAAPALWKSVRLEGKFQLEEIWKQVWPLQLAAKQSGDVPEAEAQQVISWMESLREGDEITLSLSEEFIVQDIALYSKFGLVLYSALS